MPLLAEFFALGAKTAAAMPAPYRNPKTRYKHWFHGTSGEFHDEYGEYVGDDEPAYDVGTTHHLTSPALHPPHDPGGRVQTPDRFHDEYGMHADKHWNTDLGVHFTSDPEVAHVFSGHGHHPLSRISHSQLHMANPKHYDSEFDMSRDAITWAHENGHHYLDDKARSQDKWEDHLDSGGHYAEIPDHEHMQYVDNHTDEQGRRALDDIDRRPEGKEDASGPHLDLYMTLHPEREHIVEGFKEHLRSQGHDGVTYGNEYEPPKGHRCAIPFDDHQISHSRWEWLHESKEHLNSDQGETSARHGDEVVSPDYFPGKGYHWTGPDKEHLGPMRTALLQHFGSGEPLYKQPKPGIDMDEHRRLQALDPDDFSEAERAREHGHRWDREVRRALSRGDLEPQEAWNNGYKGHGHDQTSQGAYYHDTEHHGLSWEHLPQTLWHTTTNKSGVLAAGSLKSRDELNMNHGGSGLGGGDSDTISLTHDPEVARHIHRALHEYHAVVTGKTSIQDMLDEAHQGGYLHHVVGGQYGGGKDWKDGDTLPIRLREGLKGRRVLDSVMMDTTDEIKKKHPDAEPVLDGGHFDAPKGRIYHRHSVPMNDDEKLDFASSHYKYHAAMREHFGTGEMDPGFIMNSPKAFSETHPSQFSILRVHPKPGARGYRVSALGEWRTSDGSALHIGGTESPHEPEEPQSQEKTGLRVQAKQDSSGVLPNPYHEEHNEWFHGTLGDHEDLNPQAIREGHRPAGNGAGGPQMNKLLGVHFSALHAVAHSFAGPHRAQDGQVFHAQLKMKNPIHFDSEESLLRHVWKTVGAGSGFHDEKHEGDMQWQYGSGATREGINQRIARGASPRQTHSAIEAHFQWHPRQHEMAGAYVSQLRYDGHDGITYGNGVEGPNQHYCAIAFDPKTIKVTHVDRMHPVHDYDENRESYFVKPGSRPGRVDHAHIAAIHDEPDDFLDEVNRYHNNGSVERWGRSDKGNTGKGEWKYHQAARRRTQDIPVADLLQMALPRDSDVVDEAKVAEYARQMSQHGYNAEDVDDDDDHVRLLDGRVLNGNHRIHAADDAGLSHLPCEVLRHAEAALLPGYTKEHPWLPKQGIFSATKGILEPSLWTQGQHLRPRVKKVVMGRLDQAVGGVYPDWRDWCRNYIAGGAASYWWNPGNRDLDLLVGVNYRKFRKAHPDDADLTDDQISAKITGLFRRSYNDEHYLAPWDGHEWHVTAYSNPASWNIRDIKPYSAYLVDTDRWVVKPPQVSSEWGPGSFDESLWDQAEAYLALVDAIGQIKDPVDRARRGAMLYEQLHDDRRHAFSAQGQGWKDPSNALWKYLEYHPSDPVGRLVDWTHEYHHPPMVGAS
jgi:hypothetical protein